MIAMEACLVRIMKARKKAAHTDLVDEAVSHMSRLFKVRWRKRERERELDLNERERKREIDSSRKSREDSTEIRTEITTFFTHSSHAGLP